MVVDVHLMIVAHRLFLIKAYRICNILSTTFSYYLSIISTKAGTPCFHSVPAFFVFTGSVYLLHQSAYSILTPHRFVRLLFGKTSQNWCSCGVVPQMLFEIRFKFHRIRALFLRFTARSASSWGQVKEGSQIALFPFISLSMRLPFSCSRTSPYATLHNLPAIWCKSGVVVGVVDFRPKCPICRSDLQRNGLWLPWWLLRKSPS